MKKIAVIGATGLVGRPTTEELIAAGFPVTILARKPQQAKKLFPTAIVMQADLRDKQSLEAGLSGQDIVYLSLHIKPEEKPDGWHTETDGLQNVIAAAKKVGIKRIALLSSLVMRHQGQNGFQWWVFDVKQRAVDLIKSSGIPYSIFYPSTFMENFTVGNFRQGKFVLLAGISKHPMYFISATDYGKQVARAFEIAQHENQEYVIQGLEILHPTKRRRFL